MSNVGSGHSWAQAFGVVGIVAVIVFGLNSCIDKTAERDLKWKELEHRIEMDKLEHGIVDKK
ncbi:hypothetical protein D3C81_767750 [compost metagenome]